MATSPVAGHGQTTIDGAVVVHLTPEELSALVTACRLALSALEDAGLFVGHDPFASRIDTTMGRLVEVFR